MIRSTTGKHPLISDWFRKVVCLPHVQWEKYPKRIRENPLTDRCNLAIVCRTILAPTSLILARAAKELLKVFPSLSLSFFPESFLLFFFKKVGNVLSLFIQKVQWIECKRNWEKTLINTAWPLTSQTRAYQQDLETTPETTLTRLRFEHRKRNWEKTLIKAGWSLNGQKCVYQRAL